jgi:GTP-binding protein LepA
VDQTIRNFCIIAHIDHGKSTLADRFLELTGTVQKRDMKAQMLDQMDLERERGITIKLAPVRMEYQGAEFNLIDTPGHVDFTYEVSRSLACVEGALLVVDASQGIEAQTIANLNLALEQDLDIIPVINKIDLPNADVAKVEREFAHLIGAKPEEIFHVSAKTGVGVKELLDAIPTKIREPRGNSDAPLRALIFDSQFNDYQGVVAHVRIVDGVVRRGDTIRFAASAKSVDVLEVGVFRPKATKRDQLLAGEIGYIVTGLKSVADVRVGDTVALAKSPVAALPGYRTLKPMVFAGLYCQEGDDFPSLREAMEKLTLNDSSLTFEAEHSPALGYGFRCGFLGLLHLEIVQERLRREYQLELIVTVPSVAYHVFVAGTDEPQLIRSPLELPDPASITGYEEPWMTVDVVTPTDKIGAIMSLLTERRGISKSIEYLDAERAVLHFELPLSQLLADFYDTLKSVSQGYASLNYDLLGYRPAKLVRLDILVANEKVDALSSIVYDDTSYRVGRQIVDQLKDLLPRQMFEVKVQAAIGGRIIASASLPAMRKDVTAKLYGGDVTRKRKLLEKQKKGKRRMRAMGKVDIPPAAYRAILKANSPSSTS